MYSPLFRRKTTSSIRPVGILLSGSNSALPAEGPSDSGAFTTLQGITVTATRTERDAFDVPESVSIVDQQRLEREQPQNFGQILQYLPNVDIAGGPRSIGNQVNIRGLSDDRILFLIDGARQNFTRSHNNPSQWLGSASAYGFAGDISTTHIDETRGIDSRHDITEYDTIGVNVRNNMRFGDSEFIG